MVWRVVQAGSLRGVGTLTAFQAALTLSKTVQEPGNSRLAAVRVAERASRYLQVGVFSNSAWYQILPASWMPSPVRVERSQVGLAGEPRISVTSQMMPNWRCSTRAGSRPRAATPGSG